VKQKIAMLKRWFFIFTGKNVVAIKQGRGKCYSKTEIQGYYNDLTGKVCAGTECDENGIPLTTIAGNEKVYFPIAIFQYGLGCYDRYLINRDYQDLIDFYKIICWAEQHLKENGSWDCFKMLKSAKYNVSSMCQAEGASLLYRAYKNSGQQKYLCLAEKAIDYMLLPIEEGGTAKYEGDFIYLEEYPQEPRRSVLNGWIFSIFGLYDATLQNPDRYKEKLNKTVETLANNLEFYDMKVWSRYDAVGNVASPAYHCLHIAQLDTLYDIFENDKFAIYKGKFERYTANKFFMLLAMIMKGFQKITEKSDCVVIK